MRKVLRRSSIYAFAVFTVLGIWAFWVEPSSIKVSKQPLELPSWAVHCNGLTVAVLADLHVGSPYKGLDELKEIVELTNSVEPDLVLLPGDFVIQGVVGGDFVSPENMALELAKLKSTLGVYAVLGNHDWWLDAERVSNALSDNGIKMLDDRSVFVSYGDCSFSIVGISDFWEGPHDIDKAYEGVDHSHPVIAFTHNPDLFPSVPEFTALTVAGHTHGGQVYLPVIGRPIVPSEFGQRYAIGLIEENGKYLFVSSGVGTSILPVRFRVPPEITLLELNSPSSISLHPR